MMGSHPKINLIHIHSYIEIMWLTPESCRLLSLDSQLEYRSIYSNT